MAVASRDIQIAHEQAVGERFCEFLRSRGQQPVGLRPGVIDERRGRREPDLVFELRGHQVGLEIACAYYDKVDAQGPWDSARGTRRTERTIARSVRDPERKLAEELIRTFNKHCANAPYSLSTWLVLDAFGTHAPITTDIDAADILSDLRIADQARFEAVFLCLSGHSDNQPKFFAVQTGAGP